MTGRRITRRQAAAHLRAMGAPEAYVRPYLDPRDHVLLLPSGDRVRCHKGSSSVWTLTWEQGAARTYPRCTSMDAVRAWLRATYYPAQGDVT